MALDADPDLPDIRDDDPRWVRCAVYTRQSLERPGDDPAVTALLSLPHRRLRRAGAGAWGDETTR